MYGCESWTIKKVKHRRIDAFELSCWRRPLRVPWMARRSNYWSFSFNISPSNGNPGLISFKMDWLDLLADQGTLKSPLQHHNSKAPILQCSGFFMVQLSHPYITTGKTVALTRQSKCLLILWLRSPSAVILEPRKSLSLLPFFPLLFVIK